MRLDDATKTERNRNFADRADRGPRYLFIEIAGAGYLFMVVLRQNKTGIDLKAGPGFNWNDQRERRQICNHFGDRAPSCARLTIVDNCWHDDRTETGAAGNKVLQKRGWTASIGHSALSFGRSVLQGGLLLKIPAFGSTKRSLKQKWKIMEK